MPTFATWASLDVCNAHLCNMSKFGCFQCPPLQYEPLWMFPMPTFATWAPLDACTLYNMYLKISLNYLYTALPPWQPRGGWMAMMCNENLANLLSQPNLNQLILTGGSYYSPGRSVEQGGHLPHGDYLPAQRWPLPFKNQKNFLQTWTFFYGEGIYNYLEFL